MGLTPEQAAVLDAGQRSVFVSAAAGSGKTSLLVERYVRWAVDDGVPLERLPTVTFTRRAAAELKDRIRSTLAERGRPDLAWSLETAPIGTIHSLCARLLREHPVEAGLDPEFTLLDEDASLLLRSAVWDDVWTASVLAASRKKRSFSRSSDGSCAETWCRSTTGFGVGATSLPVFRLRSRPTWNRPAPKRWPAWGLPEGRRLRSRAVSPQRTLTGWISAWSGFRAAGPRSPPCAAARASSRR